jgi:hypothetical protein
VRSGVQRTKSSGTPKSSSWVPASQSQFNHARCRQRHTEGLHLIQHTPGTRAALWKTTSPEVKLALIAYVVWNRMQNPIADRNANTVGTVRLIAFASRLLNLEAGNRPRHSAVVEPAPDEFCRLWSSAESRSLTNPTGSIVAMQMNVNRLRVLRADFHTVPPFQAVDSSEPTARKVPTRTPWSLPRGSFQCSQTVND